MRRSIRAPLTILFTASIAAGCQGSTQAERVQSASDESDVGLYAFDDQAEFDRFVARMQSLQASERSGGENIVVTGTAIAQNAGAVPPPPQAAPPPPPSPPPVAAAVAFESAEAVDAQQITNTQEAGVDEGAIVKDAGDYLVILRRGRIFTVRHGGNALSPAGSIDAFPPGAPNARNTWYDEMLVRGDQVIVVGYSYGNFGTEINRFRLGRDGSLTYRDTHYLRSGDYYSSSNYASRMIGDELIFYAPVGLNWQDWRSTMPALRRGGQDGEVVSLVDADDIYVTEGMRRGKMVPQIAHTVTRCDLSAAELDCDSTAVLGSWSRSFYVSPGSVYVWTNQDRSHWGRQAASDEPGQLYRLPLDGSRPGAVPVSGAPIDQFSFTEDREDGVLRVVLRGEGMGDQMWGSEFSGGDVGLLTVPLDAFADGSEALPQQALRELPSVVGYRFQNRFVGDYLLYTAANYGNEDDGRFFYAVPVDGREAQRVELEHGVTRFDIMGSDAVAIGPGRENALGFSAVSLGRQARIEDVYMLPAASEGEVRSQAFFYRADPGSPDGVSGMLGLPVSRQLERRGGEFLGNGSAIFFLRRDNRSFSPAGDLGSRTKPGLDDNCIASCVDWYGNARPIFLRDRVFALLGYELVEGRMEDGRIREVRRTNFTPRGTPASREGG